MEIIRAGNTALRAGSLKTRPYVLKSYLEKASYFFIVWVFSVGNRGTDLSSLGTDPTEASLVVKQQASNSLQKGIYQGSYA